MKKIIFLIIGFVFFLCGLAYAGLDFFPAQYFSAGADGPSEITVGDLNNDGSLDVVTANRGSDSVSILLGDGTGALQSALVYSMGPAGDDHRYPCGVELGYLNGDNFLDLIVINSGAAGDYPGDVASMLGNGDGTFQPPIFYSCGKQPSAVKLGDFNQDNKMDVVTTNYRSHDLTILLGNGDGTLHTAVSYATNGPCSSLDIADVDENGSLDIVVTPFYSSTVVVFLGNGDGTLQGGVSYPTAEYPDQVKFGDLNSDGKEDIVTTHRLSDMIAVLMGNGDGTFLSSTTYGAGNYPETLALGDINNDGNLDIVVEGSCLPEDPEDDAVAVLLGNGDGSFNHPLQYGVDNYATSVALGDLDNDAELDIFATSYNRGTVAVLINLAIERATLKGTITNSETGEGIPDAIINDLSAALAPNHNSALPAPTVAATTSGMTVSLSWTSVTGATGYALYYAPYPYAGPETIGSIDMGTKTSMSASLWEGAAFYVAIQAYDSVESSGYSNIEYFATVCTYSISPTSKSFTSSGGSGSVSVTTTSGCTWTATSNESWITITSGSSGNGNGTVGYSVSSNSSASTRTGTITIAGKTFTVTITGSNDMSGAYKVTNTVDATDCGEGVYTYSSIWDVTQNGNNITVSGRDGYGNPFVLTGTLNGNALSISGSYKDGGGTTTLTGNAIVSGNNFSGSATWTWRYKYGSCSGSDKISGVKQ